MDEDKFDELVDQLKEHGINPDEVIYTLSVRDVLTCIAEVYEDEIDSMSVDELKGLIKKGTDATENIPWFDVISDGVSTRRGGRRMVTKENDAKTIIRELLTEDLGKIKIKDHIPGWSGDPDNQN